MIVFIIFCGVYLALLLLIRPAPESLKAVGPTFQQHVKGIKATLFLGPFLLLIFLFASGFGFEEVDENLYRKLALPGGFDRQHIWLPSIVTHLFVHINVLHIGANVSALALLSVYEQRVGARRFLAVLGVGAAASIPSAFFYSDAFISGISGGLFGLAGAYFTDHAKLTRKEWWGAIAFFAFIFLVLLLNGEFGRSSSKVVNFQIDHFGHALGAIGGIIYCRLKPLCRVDDLSTRSSVLHS